MIYEVITTEKFKKLFKKLDRSIQKMIKAWIDKNLIGTNNPRLYGKGLTANRSGQWRYRVGNYRILADIQDNKVVLVLVDVKIPSEKPIDVSILTEEEFNAELEKGYADILTGRTKPAKQAFAEMRKYFNI